MNEENSLNKFKESIIQDNEPSIKLANVKKEIFENISPIMRKSKSNLKYNINYPQIKNEEYLDYKTKKLKLYNLYKQLLAFREKLIIKEKELYKKEKNLLEFESILKSNELILKSNIEQFDEYINNKINELKDQFRQIEQIQIEKENYLNQKEEEINNYKNREYKIRNYNNNNNNNKYINCKCDLCNENEIIKPFIDNYLTENDTNKNFYDRNEINRVYCKGCSNYIKHRNYKKNNNEYCIKNSNFHKFKNNFIMKNNNLNDKYIDFNNYTCPGCEFFNS